MNIKSIPNSQTVNSVKESTEERKQSGQGPRKEPQKKKEAKPTDLSPEQVQTPEEGDAALLASQTLDSFTLVELLSHPTSTTPKTAKFPTASPKNPAAKNAKKLNQSA